MLTQKKVICYGQTNTGNWCQEFYCTISRQARIRAKQLRDVGFKVITSSMGFQRTGAGTVKMTMLTINSGINKDTFNLPYVQVERL